MSMDQLQTGDVLLFHQTKSWLSRIIEWCSGSRYSHVAMVVRDPKFLNPDLPDGLYMLESGLEGFPDSEDHRKKFGVQIVPLRKVLDGYNGSVFVRRLRCDRGDSFREKLAEIHKRIHNKPYDLDPLDWIEAFEREHGRTTITHCHHTNRFWCSALLAYIFVQWGFLPDKTAWTFVTPKEFGTESQTDLSFQNCSLDPEGMLKK